MKRRIKNNKSAQVQIGAAIAVIIIIRESGGNAAGSISILLVVQSDADGRYAVVGEISQWSLPPGIIHFG